MDLEAIGNAARSGAPGQREALEAVAREFEALLVQEMLRAARTPIAGGGLLDGGPGGRLYRSLFHEALAREAAQQGGLGIARALLEQHAPRDTKPPEPEPRR